MFTVWDKNGCPLYVGGTENINAKSFKFDFEFEDITGYYYDFPFFNDEVDRQIVKLKPIYNNRLRSSYTKAQIMSYFRKLFYAHKRPFGAREKEYISEILLQECEPLEFSGEIFYSSFDRGYILEKIIEDYGLYSFKS